MTMLPYLWLFSRLLYPHLVFGVTAVGAGAAITALAALVSKLVLRSATWRRLWWLAIFLLLMAWPGLQWTTAHWNWTAIHVSFSTDPALSNNKAYQTAARLILNQGDAGKSYEEQRAEANDAPPAPPWREEASVRGHAPEIRKRFGLLAETYATPIWLLVSTLGLAWLGTRHILGLFWLRRHTEPAPNKLKKVADEVGLLLGLSRPVPVVLVRAALSPLVHGVWRPRLVLPMLAADWSQTVLRPVLLHEFAHIQRRDPLLLAVTRIGCWLTWWNPFTHLAAAMYRHHSEGAADEFVLAKQEDASFYAETLVQLARDLQSQEGLADGVCVVRRSSMERRLRALLSFDMSKLELSSLRRGILVAGLCVASAIAVFKIGYATEPMAPHTGKVSPLDPLLKQVMEHFIATEKARQEKTRFLHFVLDQATSYELPDGTRIDLPAPTHLEGWIDIWSGARRFEYRPQVTREINSSIPFLSRDVTLINDGHLSYYITPDVRLENLRGFPTDRRQVFQEDGTQEQNTALMTAQTALAVLASDNAVKAKSSSACQLRWIIWKGTRVAELTQEFFFSSGSKPSQREVLRFDPSHDDALCSYQLSFPAREEGIRSDYEVQQFAQTASGFYYPSVYFTYSDLSRVERKDIQSWEWSTTKFSRYDVIDALPPHITDVPQAKGSQYVANTPNVVQPAAIWFVVIDMNTRRPVAGAQVKLRVNHHASVALTTDASGAVALPLPREAITFLSVRSAAPGYVPQSVVWRKYANPLKFPDTYQMQLTAGSPIGGRIVDEAGKPVAGAEVTAFLLQPSDTISAYTDRYDLLDVRVMTDADGRWHFDAFPPELDGFNIRVSHPGFQATTDYGSAPYTQASGLPSSSLRDGSSVIVLKRGNQISGLVTGADGKPVAGARLVVGQDMWGTNLPETKSDPFGHFQLTGIGAGTAILTVQADGYKPQVLPLVMPITQPLAIKLQTGQVLLGRVVNPDGTPCVGYRVQSDTWNKLRTLNYTAHTDPSGRFVWSGAPDDPVTFYIGGGRDHELRDLVLQATGKEQTIIMKPALHLVARVIDKKTGQPISKFKVTPGLVFANSPDPIWEGQDVLNGVQGTFDWKTARLGPSCVFKVEADGYETFVSQGFPSDQTDSQATFALSNTGG